MFLKSLKLTNVRNHKNSIYDFIDQNILIGENGSGKTTVLESIYLLFAMRGFKKQPISNILSFEETFLRIETNILLNNTENSIVLKYDGSKSLLIENTPIEKISDYVYNFPISCYTPDAPCILSNSQNERRNFIDRFIFYTDKNHIEDIKVYNRFILQKSALLNEESLDETYLDILNDKITDLSTKISQKRVNFIETINKSLDIIYKQAIFPVENVFISYKTNINNSDILKKELFSHRCDYGVHHDKINMCLDSKVIEKFSSVGQRKTFILLTLLSSLKNVEKKREISIITLLDDFEATLDKRRASFLKESFCDGRQAIFTGVDNSRLSFKNVINL